MRRFEERQLRYDAQGATTRAGWVPSVFSIGTYLVASEFSKQILASESGGFVAFVPFYS